MYRSACWSGSSSSTQCATLRQPAPAARILSGSWLLVAWWSTTLARGTRGHLLQATWCHGGHSRTSQLERVLLATSSSSYLLQVAGRVYSRRRISRAHHTYVYTLTSLAHSMQCLDGCARVVDQVDEHLSRRAFLVAVPTGARPDRRTNVPAIQRSAHVQGMFLMISICSKFAIVSQQVAGAEHWHGVGAQTALKE